MRADHIFVKRLGGMYEHHGIDCGDGSVIHYTTKGMFETGRVMRTSMEDFSKGTEVETRDYTEVLKQLAEPDGWIESSSEKFNQLMDQALGISEDKPNYSTEAVMTRARSRIGDHRFDIVFHNCEHFATWCKTGVSSSKQVIALWKRALNPRFYGA